MARRRAARRKASGPPEAAAQEPSKKRQKTEAKSSSSSSSSSSSCLVVATNEEGLPMSGGAALSLEVAQATFQEAITEELGKLKIGGLNHDAAVQKILGRLSTSYRNKVDQKEVSRFVSRFGVSKEDATRAVVVAKEFRNLKRDWGLDPTAAIRELTKKVRTSSIAIPAPTAKSRPNSEKECMEMYKDNPDFKRHLKKIKKLKSLGNAANLTTDGILSSSRKSFQAVEEGAIERLQNTQKRKEAPVTFEGETLEGEMPKKIKMEECNDVGDCDRKERRR